MSILLSILICTVTGRVEKHLPLLVQQIQKQVDDQQQNNIEILYFGDNKKRSIGRKRNDLLKLAQGKYVCFLDDDDKISSVFISRLMPHLHVSTDIICYMVECSVDGGTGKPVYYNKNHTKNTNYPEYYERMPNHLMVVKRELALQTLFKDISFGEDKDYSIRLKPLLQSQILIEEVLYYYIYDKLTSEAESLRNQN
jgi:glycosyltransferase involved in cell wall biosynthesis